MHNYNAIIIAENKNLFRLKTTWTDKECINEEDNADYLKQFADIFEKQVWNLVERGVKKQSTISPSGEIYGEVLEHSQDCVEKVKRFYGRESEIEQIKKYLMSTSNRPLVLYGESGCGKTSIMAKASMLV